MIPHSRMSTVSLRHHAFTLAYLPVRRARRIESAMRTVCLRLSARRVRQIMRSVFP